VPGEAVVTAISLLAHQGGWDEALFVVGPLIFIVLLLRMAKRRADRAARDRLD
jgi:hypothetical protein